MDGDGGKKNDHKEGGEGREEGRKVEGEKRIGK